MDKIASRYDMFMFATTSYTEFCDDDIGVIAKQRYVKN